MSNFFRWHLPLLISLLVSGITLGFFVGLCESPIAVTFIPLAFGFLTSGGLLYSFFKNKTSDSKGPDATERRKRVAFVAFQASGFSVGLLFGFWCGIHAKLHPETFWSMPTTTSAYDQLNFANIDQMMSFRNIDLTLANDEVSQERRLEILRQLKATLDASAKSSSTDTNTKTPATAQSDPKALSGSLPSTTKRETHNLSAPQDGKGSAIHTSGGGGGGRYRTTFGGRRDQLFFIIDPD